VTPEWYASQPKEEVKRCNLCGGTRFKPFAREDRYGLPVESVQCKSCRLIFLNPRMTTEAYAEFYRNGTYRELLSEFYGRPFTTQSIEEDQRKYADKVIGLLAPHQVRLVSWLDPFSAGLPKRLLDIGGSTGVVAEAVAKQFGLDAIVIEPSEVEAKRAMSRGLRVWSGMIEDFEPDRALFDAILLCQTMDHLLDIMGALRTIRTWLADDGLFFCDLAWNNPIKVDHPYYLDDHTAKDYFRRAGFKALYEGKDADGTHLNYLLGRA